jgi:hypothetical protein
MIRALFRDCRAVLCLPRLWVQTRLGVPPGIRPALAPMTLTLALRSLRLDALEAWSVGLWLAAAIRGVRYPARCPGAR